MVVVSTCTNEKAIDHPRRLRLEDFRDPARLRTREVELAEWRLPAGKIYTGKQHIEVMDGAQQLRRRFGPNVVDLRIISTGYGLVGEHCLLAPYEASFNDMSLRQALDWGKRLGIPEDVRAAVRGFPLVLFLLGDRYLRVIEPPLSPDGGQRFVYLAKPDLAEILACPGVTVVRTGMAETTIYGAAAVWLKGRMFNLFARAITQHGEPLLRTVCRDNSPASFLRALKIGKAFL